MDRALDLSLAALPLPAAVDEARRRRALVAGILGERGRGRAPARASAPATTPGPASPSDIAPATARLAAGVATPTLADAVVIPAGATLRGYVRAPALLLAGDLVGNVHCTAGPVVVRAGATLEGRIVASGDVYVRGRVGDAGGGAVISTRGKVTLAAGGRIDGDVRCGRFDLHDGGLFAGVSRSFQE